MVFPTSGSGPDEGPELSLRGQHSETKATSLGFFVNNIVINDDQKSEGL